MGRQLGTGRIRRPVRRDDAHGRVDSSAWKISVVAGRFHNEAILPQFRKRDRRIDQALACVNRKEVGTLLRASANALLPARREVRIRQTGQTHRLPLIHSTFSIESKGSDLSGALRFEARWAASM
jgi:hypothetical protein